MGCELADELPNGCSWHPSWNYGPHKGLSGFKGRAILDSKVPKMSVLGLNCDGDCPSCPSEMLLNVKRWTPLQAQHLLFEAYFSFHFRNLSVACALGTGLRLEILGENLGFARDLVLYHSLLSSCLAASTQGAQKEKQKQLKSSKEQTSTQD